MVVPYNHMVCSCWFDGTHFFVRPVFRNFGGPTVDYDDVEYVNVCDCLTDDRVDLIVSTLHQ